MPDPSIQLFISALSERYSFQRYGSAPDEEHGIGFRIAGIAATFSVLTRDGVLPIGTYDVQIESYPAGGYIYFGEHSLEELLLLFERYRGPFAWWPKISEG